MLSKKQMENLVEDFKKDKNFDGCKIELEKQSYPTFMTISKRSGAYTVVSSMFINAIRRHGCEIEYVSFGMFGGDFVIGIIHRSTLEEKKLENLI